jgi:hypothetical protein
MKSARLGAAINEVTPEVNRRLIGDQLAAAGILEENAADLTVALETSKYIAAGAMKKTGDGPEDFALRSLARPWSAEQ